MKKLTSVFICLLLAIPCQARTIFVDANTPDNYDGSSWPKAYKYLQDALVDAYSTGDVNEIRVAQGIYTPDSNSADPNGSGDREAAFQLINGVAVKGGFAGFGQPDPNERNIKMYETILSGDLDGNDVDVNDTSDLLTEPTRDENSYHVVTGSGTKRWAILDGFIITAGNANGRSYPDYHSNGGGLYNRENSSPTITNCTFSANSAIYGGGMYNYGQSSPTLTNCTFSANSADGHGGGMYNDGSSPTVTNCILWDNTAPIRPQIYNDGTSSTTVTYSNIQGGYEGEGNIDADPCFVAPGYWDANGTPEDSNDDFWVDSDYHLKSQGWRWHQQRKVWTWDDVTSRCIDAGNPGSPLADEPINIPDDPNNIWGQNLRINMGAYGGTAEASMAPYDWAILGDLTNDGLVNLKDYAFQAADWLNSADQQPGDLNRDSLVYISDLALLVEDWLEQTTWHE